MFAATGLTFTIPFIFLTVVILGCAYIYTKNRDDEY